MRSFTVSTLALFGALASLAQAARPVPDGLKKLRDQITSQGQCNSVIAGGYSNGGGSGDVSEYSHNVPQDMMLTR